MPQTLASFIELSARAYRQNVEVFRALAQPGQRLGAVLKGNAYGHGFEPILGLAHPLVDVLYVIRPEEALAIRRWEARQGAGHRDVLVLGAVTANECVELAQHRVAVVAASTDFAKAAPLLRHAGLRLETHVHLDTGLGREGFTLEQLKAGALSFLETDQDVFDLAGVMSHFANTEDVTEQEYARHQLAQFDQGCSLLAASAKPSRALYRHFAASAASLVLPASRLDVLRVGIALYGLWPSTETRLSARVVLGAVPHLEPVLSWRVPSQIVKWLPAGSYIGYGCSYRCAANTRVAVLPIGYYDGYSRLASGKAHVLVNGQRCPVVGRVMMNHLIADVTHATTDERPLLATLLGRDADELISAETLAGWSQTIHYETVTRIGSHLLRVVV